MVNLHLTL